MISSSIFREALDNERKRQDQMPGRVCKAGILVSVLGIGLLFVPPRGYSNVLIGNVLNQLDSKQQMSCCNWTGILRYRKITKERTDSLRERR